MQFLFWKYMVFLIYKQETLEGLLPYLQCTRCMKNFYIAMYFSKATVLSFLFFLQIEIGVTVRDHLFIMAGDRTEYIFRNHVKFLYPYILLLNYSYPYMKLRKFFHIWFAVLKYSLSLDTHRRLLTLISSIPFKGTSFMGQMHLICRKL